VPVTLISRPLRVAPWLPTDITPLARAIVERALTDVGIWEDTGDNRGTQVDEYNRRAKVAPGSSWCASAVAAWWEDAGAEVPPGRASCDAWMKWAFNTKRWSRDPTYGAAVLYGIPGDARHIGVIVRMRPVLCSVEGNTIVGVSFSRNGVAVDFKEVATRSVLGYCWPTPLSEVV
jgi:hypothetical protein